MLAKSIDRYYNEQPNLPTCFLNEKGQFTFLKQSDGLKQVLAAYPKAVNAGSF
jgi:hypothetical protein